MRKPKLTEIPWRTEEQQITEVEEKLESVNSKSGKQIKVKWLKRERRKHKTTRSFPEASLKITKVNGN